jgi:hypothetical protein
MGQLQKYRRILEKASKKRPGKLLALRKSGSPVRTKLGTGKSGSVFNENSFLSRSETVALLSPWLISEQHGTQEQSRLRPTGAPARAWS